MNSKRSILLVAIFAALGLLLLIPVREARRAARESGQRSLLVQAERQLAAYRAQHGVYPDSLVGLRFEFYDGADASTLKRLVYKSDGQYYRLVTKSDWDGSEISVCH
jgi:type II secretory pathway pseudopilin PulG